MRAPKLNISTVKKDAFQIYHEFSYWIKLISSSIIIITLICSNYDLNFFYALLNIYWYATYTFIFLGSIGAYEFVNRLRKRDLANYEVKDFPDYILKIAQDFGLKDIKFYLLKGEKNFWYDAKKNVFLIGEVTWNILTPEEKKGILAHEFVHTKKIYECLVIVVSCIMAVILYFIIRPSHYIIVNIVDRNLIKFIMFNIVPSLSVVYVCGIFLWLRELNADRYSLKYITIEKFQSGLSKISSLHNSFSFTHPSVNFRIWFLHQYDKNMRGQLKQ